MSESIVKLTNEEINEIAKKHNADVEKWQDTFIGTGIVKADVSIPIDTLLDLLNDRGLLLNTVIAMVNENTINSSFWGLFGFDPFVPGQYDTGKKDDK